MSMVSHEFRTPLTIIDGHAQRMIKTKERLSAEEIAERAGKAFRDSWDGLVSCAQVVALVGVVLTPWLPLIAVVAGIGWLVYRRMPKPVVAAPVAEKPTA